MWSKLNIDSLCDLNISVTIFIEYGSQILVTEPGPSSSIEEHEGIQIVLNHFICYLQKQPQDQVPTSTKITRSGKFNTNATPRDF